jgi:hypothetical protein
VVRAAAKDLIDSSEIVDVRPVRVVAQFEGSGTPSSRIATANIEVASGFVADVGIFSSKFEFRIVLHAVEGEPIARFEFDLIVDYRVDDGFAPDRDAADFVTGTTGYFAAYPYARELLHSLSARLRLDPVVLGFLKKRTDGGLETFEIGVLQRPQRSG